MKFPIFCLTLALWLSFLTVSAQDTLKIMQYNLLNYGNATSYCTSSNNNLNSKNTYLKTIINYVKPDVFTVVEMGQDVTYIDGLLSNVMNTGGRNYYQRAVRTNYSGSDLVNMLYYDSRKLVHKKTNALAGTYRDINIYTMYHNGPELLNGDTIWLNFIIAHLKAGSTASDADQRAVETASLMNYLNALNPTGNYFVMGDFNLYTSTETAYQNLVAHANSNIRFYDPVSRPGNWNNNSDFSDVHTQSTHTADNGCAASGGLDDRFDFILTGMNVLTGQKGVKYIAGTYKALAQDGNHFNKSLIDAPTISSVPDSIVQALYNNSDHLPVRMDILIDRSTGIGNAYPYQHSYEINSVSRESVNFRCYSANPDVLNIILRDLQGREICRSSEKIGEGSNEIRLTLPDITGGIYLLNLQAGNDRPHGIRLAIF